MDRIDLKTRLVAVKIIREVLVFKKPFKSTFAKHLNDKSLSLLDIRFITEISKGTIRMSKRMRYEISNHYNGKFNKLEDLYIVILEIGVYQLDYMSNVPSYAAVSTSVDITKIFFPKYSSLTNALLRNMLSNRADLKNLQ